ncbi:hypothetical protein EDI_247530 [Entamoeba dispar SAW760]|uniref:Uncharacterized protein n=1 Tax=Entamoeba dispar (strain ATCC PRA-260 / SAW760) TaxID=370354 RepID=B0EUV4_ENTDS|nr:uncharacterized protein EDI_247530 [Entamoeba dispar SAW760]EDR21678.1 hypothetical protein EDI_247530 [Entamoeba dispar SAW760]|eukprot:EDR21678.1 hypothetical protein EDI_247530 [Entamoeba dispar SAW760]
MKTLEPFYLSIVALYLKGTTTFQLFLKVSKNCENAIKMLHINPYNVVAYLPYLIKVIPNISALYINALEAQDLLTSKEVEMITWIDSTKNQCDISKLNETISEKVLNVRINNSQIQFLYKLKNVQKVIIEQINNINEQNIAILKHLQSLKILVLYFKKINQESIDLIVRYSQQQSFVVINIVVDNYFNRIGETKNIHYFNHIKQEKVMLGEEVITFNNCILDEETFQFRLNKYSINRIKELIIETDILDIKSLCLNNYIISKLSITIHKGCTFFLKLPSKLEELNINAPKCIILMKDTKDWKIRRISIKCDIRIVDNEFKEVSKTQLININEVINYFKFISYNGKYRFNGVCNLVTLHLECAFDFLELENQHNSMRWYNHNIVECIIVNRWCNCTINCPFSFIYSKFWLESGAYEMTSIENDNEKIIASPLIAKMDDYYLKEHGLIKSRDSNTSYKKILIRYNTRPYVLELTDGLKKLKCQVMRCFEMDYGDYNYFLKHGVYVLKSKNLNKLDLKSSIKHILNLLIGDKKRIVDNEYNLEIRTGQDYIFFNDFLAGYGNKNNKRGAIKIPVDQDETAIIYYSNSLSIIDNSYQTATDNNQKVLYKDSLKENKYKPNEIKRLLKENKKEQVLELLDYEKEDDEDIECLDEEAEQYLWKE